MNMAINIQSILIVLGIGLVTGLLLGKIYKNNIRHFKTYDVIMTSLRDFIQDPKTRNFNYCRKYKEDGDN